MFLVDTLVSFRRCVADECRAYRSCELETAADEPCSTFVDHSSQRNCTCHSDMTGHVQASTRFLAMISESNG